MYDELDRLSELFSKEILEAQRAILKHDALPASSDDLAMIGAQYWARLRELRAYERAYKDVEEIRQKTLQKEI